MIIRIKPTPEGNHPSPGHWSETWLNINFEIDPSHKAHTKDLWAVMPVAHDKDGILGEWMYVPKEWCEVVSKD